MVNTKNNQDSWDPKLYDGKHSFVSKYGNDLLDLLNPQNGEIIVDLGCGTGDLANKISEYGAQIVGIDKSEKMIKQAKDKYPEINFKVGDITRLGYTNEFDAVFSNAMLHWVRTPKEALECIFQSLKVGGRFVAEFGGKDNVQIITNEVKKQLSLVGFQHFEDLFPWYFPSVGEYTSLMEKVGFRVTFASHFDRPTTLDGQNGLRNWMEMFGQTMFQTLDEITVNEVVKKVENNLKDTLYHDNNWIADYKRIRVVGVKE